MLEDADVQRALVVAAHPDDVDFGAAGTVATWTDAGIEVVYCVVTDGDAGGFDDDVPRHEMGPMRRREQAAAAKAVGVERVCFLGYADGLLEPSIRLRRDIARVIREVRPQRVLCQSPQRNFHRIFASHPDHLAAGEAALCAVYPDARNPYTFTELVEEGLGPWTVPEVWIMGGPNPDRAVDVTDQIDRKLRAILAHESQHPNPTGLEERIRGWLTGTAAQFGLGEGRLAEAFQVIQTG